MNNPVINSRLSEYISQTRIDLSTAVSCKGREAGVIGSIRELESIFNQSLKKRHHEIETDYS